MRRLLLRLLLVLLGLEIGSFVAYRAARGEWFSWSEHARRRGEVLDAEPADRFFAGRVAVPWNVEIHPYFGFGAPSGFALVEPARDPRLDDPDVVLVGVTGGSVAQGFARAGGAALAAEIARIPRFAGKSVEIVELGQFAWKQPQQLTALAYYLALGGRLDLLVNLDGHNEVVDAGTAHRLGLFPAYPYLWRSLTRNAMSQEEARRIGTAVFWRDVRRRAAAAAAYARASVTGNVVWDVVDRAIERRIVATNAAAAEDAGGPSRRFATAEELRDFSARLWSDSSIRMRDLAEASGASYFHFLQPNQYLEGSKTLTDEERRDAFDPRRRGARRGYPHLLRRADDLRRAGVRFHSLVDVYLDVEETVYVDECCHVNARGNEILAHAVARAIREAED